MRIVTQAFFNRAQISKSNPTGLVGRDAASWYQTRITYNPHFFEARGKARFPANRYLPDFGAVFDVTSGAVRARLHREKSSAIKSESRMTTSKSNSRYGTPKAHCIALLDSRDFARSKV